MVLLAGLVVVRDQIHVHSVEGLSAQVILASGFLHFLSMSLPLSGAEAVLVTEWLLLETKVIVVHLRLT